MNFLNTCGPNYKFAGMERDSESGLDHTLFRQSASNQGRWLSPDPIGGDISNPQSLNRYAYVLNNPTTLIDPLGLAGCRLTGECDRDPHILINDAPVGFSALNGDVGSCVFDGLPTGCGVVYSAVNSGAAVQCPNNFCSGFAPVGNGQIAFIQFAAHAGLGGSGYDVLTQPIPDPSLPINQIYAAYQLACQHSATRCGNNDPVSVRLQGLTYNVLLNGSVIDPSSVGIRDPVNFVHGAPSWYDFSPIDAGHYAATQSGVDAHFDAFNGVLLFPLHEIFDYLPSLFINPKPGVSFGTYTCSVGVGCHQ